MSPQGDRGQRVGQRTQPNLHHLLQVIERPAPPEIMERRRRALLEIVDTMRPQDPLWTVVGVPCPATEADYMAFLRLLCERAGLSIQQIASRTEFDATIETVPRSTVHTVLKRNRLPRREDQLRALLVVLIKANHGTGADLDSLLNLRAQLVATRTEAGHGSDTTEECPTVHFEPVAEPVDEPVAFACTQCARGKDAMELARAVSLLLMAFATVVLMTIAALQFIL